MWQYSITFISSLVVALLSVWLAQSWSARRERSKTLEYLKSEISGNIKDCKLISEWLDKDFDTMTKGDTALTPYLRLHDSVWYSVRGSLISDYAIATQLEDAYRLISVVNNLLGRIEELRYRRIDETSKGFSREALKEALKKSGVEETDWSWEAASILSIDAEGAYRRTYAQHNAAAKGYIQKLLMLLPDLESQIAAFRGKQSMSSSATPPKSPRR